MRGIFTDSDMMVTDSTVAVAGATHEGMVVVGALSLTNSKLTVSSKPNDYIPAIVTKNFNIVGSEVTANGGFDLMDWNEGNTDGISLSITPANGKLAEFKVDSENWDGSAAVHFKEGSESPYDTAVNFSADEMNWLGAYRYIYIGEHIHTGGTATCEKPAVCEDCGRPYDNALGHNAVKTEAKAATCTEDGNSAYWTCENCGKYFSDENATKETTLEQTVIPATGHNWGEPEWSWSNDGKTCTVTFTCANDETHKESPNVTVTSAVKTLATCTENGVTTYTATVNFNGETYTDTKDVADIPAIGHSYEDGKCTVCGAADPNYKPTESDNGNSDSSATGETTSPETGDNSNMMLWIALLFLSGGALSVVTYRKKKQAQ